MGYGIMAVLGILGLAKLVRWWNLPEVQEQRRLKAEARQKAKLERQKAKQARRDQSTPVSEVQESDSNQS